MFQLPGFQDLTTEQHRIFGLPADGTHLVIGPPGTGKTVVAVHRASFLKAQATRSTLLVYNRVLNQYMTQAAASVDIRQNMRRFYGWFGPWYSTYVGKPIPSRSNREFDFDWDRICTDLDDKLDALDRDYLDPGLHLLIDEGQDLPIGFYRALRRITGNVTIFADENQQLHDRTNAQINMMRGELQIEKTHKLEENFRNTAPIAEFASAFCSGLETGIPKPPKKAGDKPILYQNMRQAQVVESIRNYVTSRSSGVIGLLLPSQPLVSSYVAELRKVLPADQLYSYSWQTKDEINFAKARVIVLNYQSAKGLEFDAVYLPELTNFINSYQQASLVMTFYVMTSRARSELYLAAPGNYVPAILKKVEPSLYETVCVN